MYIIYMEFKGLKSLIQKMHLPTTVSAIFVIFKDAILGWWFAQGLEMSLIGPEIYDKLCVISKVLRDI